MHRFDLFMYRKVNVNFVMLYVDFIEVSHGAGVRYEGRIGCGFNSHSRI